MSLLVGRLVAIDEALADIPHAFGGAIALAFCTGEPRGTVDLDVNVFLPAADASTALACLPPDIEVTAANRRELDHIGQTRAWWDETPIDLFFDTDPFHTIAALRVRHVPFAGRQIPVLDCTTLAVFKAFFNRTKDWADLEAMAESEQLDVDAVSGFLRDLLGDDPRIERLDELAG